MQKEENKYYKIIRGGGGSAPPPCYPGPPPDPHTPVEATEGILKDSIKTLSRTETEVTDLISEGPIEGLVTGSYNFLGEAGRIGWTGYNFIEYTSKDNNPYLRSVFWRSIPLINDIGEYNYSQINFRYDNGDQVRSYSLTSTVEDQVSTNNIPQASRTLALGDVLRYGKDFIKQYDFKSSNISQIIVSLKIDALYDQQNDPKKDMKTYNLGCGASVKASTTLGDIRDRTIEYNFKIYKIQKNGLTLIINQNSSSTGKITSGFIDKFTFNLSNTNPDEDGFIGYRIAIERLTPESTVVNLKDLVSVHAITEVFREEYIYPKTAVFKNLFTAEYFQDVPARTYDVKLLKVKIPSNYDPVKKTYSGDWDGRFSDEYHPSGAGLYWTDNPAWCYYDLLTNKRYGLGQYITDSNVDKWNLYQIGQYCDTIVDDGFGGLEPRFTCNVIINDFSDAFTLLNDFASIFRGMSYYANGSIYAIADMPKNPYVLFTNSNVENGDFSYSSSSKKTRNTVAIVRYNDIGNFAKPTIEYIEDADGVRKYGIRKIEITAFGCTSRGQAYRLGKWALASQQIETETVDFVAGLDSLYVKPGDVIKVQDSNRIMQRLGGRVVAINTGISGFQRFILDEEYSKISNYFSTYAPGKKYKFEVLTPGFRVTGTNYSDFLSGYDKTEIQSGLFTISNISGVSGYDPERVLAQIDCNKLFDSTNYYLNTGAVWTVQTTGTQTYPDFNAETELYRVIGINEVEPNKYSINAIEYNPTKYNYIESGTTLSDAPVVNPITIKEASRPSGFGGTGIYLYSGSDQIYLNYLVNKPEDVTTKSTSSWKVYAKSGSDFLLGTDTEARYANSNGFIVNVPKENFLVDSLRVNQTGPVTGNFIPTTNNITYYFRVYGENSQGYYSRDYASRNFFYNSQYLLDYTNLILLENFQYQTAQDTLSNVGLSLPSGNLFHSPEMSFNWEIDNILVTLKEWKNSNVIYRLLFGTGAFSAADSYTNNIKTYFLNLNDSLSPYSAYTGFDSLVDTLTDETISGFWLAIDASGISGIKYSSQLTQASQNYTRSDGYIFGEFNSEPVKNVSINQNNVYLDNTSNMQIVIDTLPSYMGNIFVFFTDNSSRTGLLTTSNLNTIMARQFQSPYTSFIKTLQSSGIQLREAFYDGSSRFSTRDPFLSTTTGLLRSGYATFRFSNVFSDALMNQYSKNFIDGSIYDSGNYPAATPQAVYYGSYPTGALSGTFRWPNTDGLGNPINSTRQIVNNIMFLPQFSNTPYSITSQMADTVSNDQLSGLSGYFENKISGLSGFLTGNYFRYNTNNIADLRVSGNFALSGSLNITGNGGTLLFNPNQIVTGGLTGHYAPSGYFNININGTGVRVPYFRAA
jgi:hypothetical protein